MSINELTTTTERALVGGILSLGSGELALVRSEIQSSLIGDQVARLILEAACVAGDRGDDVSPVTVAQVLERDGTLDSVGGLDGLDRIRGLHRPGERAAIIKRVATHALVRSTARRSAKLAKLGETPEALENPDRYLAAVSHVADKARAGLRRGSVDAKTAAMLGFTSWKTRGTVSRAAPSQNRQLTAMLGGGYQGKRFYVTGARPGVGKSALAIGDMYHCADMGHPQLMFSLEMPVEDITGRAVVQRLGLDNDRYQRGYKAMTAGEVKSIVAEFGRLSHMPVELDCEERDVGAILAKARVWLETVARPHIEALIQAEQEANPESIVVSRWVPIVWIDFLTRCTLAGKFGNRDEQIGAMTDLMARFARAEDCAVNLLCQINRANKKDKRPPRADDLRESGNIEQDAGVAILIDREAGAAMNDDAPGRAVEQDAVFIVDKNKWGPTGVALATWNGPSGKFVNRVRPDYVQVDHAAH